MIYATCHPDRKHLARGKCRACYLRDRRLPFRKARKSARVPDCHPSRRHGGHGLCQVCYKREHAEKNREKRVARQRARYEADPALRERAALAASHWANRNRERMREHQRANSARRRDADGGKRIDREMWASARWSTGGRCYYCGECAGDKIHVDHVVALTRGGRTEPSNLVPACQRCNSSKATRDAVEWLTSGWRADDPRFEPARRRMRNLCHPK